MWENVNSLTGRTAPPEYLQKLTYLCWNHHPEILFIDTVRAYTFGSHYFTEVDIVLARDMPLHVSMDASRVWHVRGGSFIGCTMEGEAALPAVTRSARIHDRVLLEFLSLCLCMSITWSATYGLFHHHVRQTGVCVTFERSRRRHARSCS